MGYGKNGKAVGSSGSSAQKKRSTAKVPFSDFRFVRIELLEPDKESFRSLLASGEFESLSPDDFVGEGYKVSFAETDAEKSIICSVSMAKADHHNAGLILTGRGRDSATALAVVAFKHIYLCQDTLWREAESQRGGSYSDIG